MTDDEKLDKLISEVKRKREEYHEKRRLQAEIDQLKKTMGMDAYQKMEDEMVKDLADTIDKKILEDLFKLGDKKQKGE